MPQMRSQATGDNDSIGPNSRYMTVVNQCLAQQRRCQIVQDLDARMARMKIQVMERNAHAQDHRYKRMQRRLRDSLERNLAYKLVVDEHNIAKSDDYHEALDGKYTYDALKPEVHRMMERMKPSYIREQKAKMQLRRSRDAQRTIIERNLDHPSLQLAQEKGHKERQRHRKEAGGDGGDPLGSRLHRSPQEAEGTIVASTGSFLLNRWASTFVMSKTPTDNELPTPNEGDEEMDGLHGPTGGTRGDGTSVIGRGKLFRKGGVLATPHLRRGALRQPRPTNHRKLKPIARSLDAKSLSSLKSETSGAPSQKALSDGARIKTKPIQMEHIYDAEMEEEASIMAFQKKVKRARKRYTLPPVKVRKEAFKQTAA